MKIIAIFLALILLTGCAGNPKYSFGEKVGYTTVILLAGSIGKTTKKETQRSYAMLSDLWYNDQSHYASLKERDPSVRRAFHRNNPCPSTGKTSGSCPGYHVDHIIPLSCGGSDTVGNMQWLTAEANLRKGGCR